MVVQLLTFPFGVAIPLRCQKKDAPLMPLILFFGGIVASAPLTLAGGRNLTLQRQFGIQDGVSIVRLRRRPL
jgi:hypothetical protein